MGKNIFNVCLKSTTGSRHADPNKPGSIQAVSLDGLIEEKKIRKVRILKIDNDGFDYDVLESAMANLKKHRPMLFLNAKPTTNFKKLPTKT